MGGMSGYHYAAMPLGLYLYSLPIVFFYILSFRKTASELRKSGITCPKESTWLLLLPVIGIVWSVVLMLQMKKSLEKKPELLSINNWWLFGMIAACTGVVYLFAAFPIITGAVNPMNFLQSNTFNTLAGATGLLWMISVVFAVLHWTKLVAMRKSISSVV